MVLKAKNHKQITKYLSQMANRVESALVFNLEVAVAELVNHAKQNAGYEDQTTNLKSSIGGVVLKNGRPVQYKGFEGVGSGSSTGLEFLNSLIGQYSEGYVILLVAGMEYASYVEDYYGLNVLKKTELKMNRELPVLVSKLKSKIEKL